MRPRARSSTGTILIVLLGLVALSPITPASSSAAATKIQSFYDALLSTMKDGPAIGPKGRYERLKPVIGLTFDIPYMAQAVVGLVWASASAAEQQEMANAFRRYVTATYADRFDSYSGQQFQVSGEQLRGTNTIVDTRIVKADGKPVIIKYLMRQNGGEWRIADVYLDGTISELATRRSEFSSIVRQKGIDGLTAILNQKADTVVGGRAN